jgi:hypothetical protein
MNAFARKKALTDASRRERNSRRPSVHRQGIAYETKLRRVLAITKPGRKYDRHGFQTPPGWTPDDLNDIAF